MSLLFRYTPLLAKRPIASLGGRWDWPLPLILVTLVGPSGSYVKESLLDTGATDTVFPDGAATTIGLDLSQAPVGEAGGVGGGVLPLRYAPATFRITDGKEFREWTAI